MVAEQGTRALLIEDVLKRYESTWSEQAIPRREAKEILTQHLDVFLGEVGGVGREFICLGLGETKIPEKEMPFVQTPLLAVTVARQRIAYLLHQHIRKNKIR